MDRLKNKTKRGVYEINKLIIGDIKPVKGKQAKVKRNIYEHIRTTEMMVRDLIDVVEETDQEEYSLEIKVLAEESLRILKEMLDIPLQQYESDKERMPKNDSK